MEEEFVDAQAQLDRQLFEDAALDGCSRVCFGHDHIGDVGQEVFVMKTSAERRGGMQCLSEAQKQRKTESSLQSSYVSEDKACVQELGVHVER